MSQNNQNFFSCYENIKLMDKENFVLFPTFSKTYRFEEDLEFFTQNKTVYELKEFVSMIKLLRIKVFDRFFTNVIW